MVNKLVELEIGFLVANDLWIAKKDFELIERSLKQANLPSTITAKPLLNEMKRIYMPTTLEARKYCEPFQEFNDYLTKKYGQNYNLDEAISILQGEFAEKHKDLYTDIMHCLFFNYCITVGLGQILLYGRFEPNHLFILLPNPPTFDSRGITFRNPLEVENKEIKVSLIYFKGTEAYKAHVLIHELGHQLGISSCPNKNCVMSKCDYIDEYATSLPTKFCNTCKQKIEEHISHKNNNT